MEGSKITVEVLDALCGTGKTHAIIDWMHRNPLQRYLYVSPLISEIDERIIPKCSELGFKTPESGEGRRKSDHLLDLLREGHNIAFTHNLYTRMTKQHMSLIKEQGYVLIIDEEVSMIEPLESSSGGNSGYTNSDLKYLYNDGKVRVDSTDFGRLLWLWDDYGDEAKYSRLKAMCELGMIYCADYKIERGTREQIDEIHSLVTQLPLQLLECSKRVVLLSYLFEGSIMDSFLKMKGVEVVPLDMEKEGIKLRYSTDEVKESIRPLINFIETPSTKKVGRKRLSYTYYANDFTEEDAKEISAAIRSVGRESGAKAKDMMWTCPQDRAIGRKKNRNYIRPRGYSAKECYVFCSARATNDYDEKHTLVHALYRHPNLTVERYLNHYGIPIDTDNFALSELIQWIWRSRVRNKQPINLSILSARMRLLFLDWLDSET